MSMNQKLWYPRAGFDGCPYFKKREREFAFFCLIVLSRPSTDRMMPAHTPERDRMQFPVPLPSLEVSFSPLIMPSSFWNQQDSRGPVISLAYKRHSSTGEIPRVIGTACQQPKTKTKYLFIVSQHPIKSKALILKISIKPFHTNSNPKLSPL